MAKLCTLLSGTSSHTHAFKLLCYRLNLCKKMLNWLHRAEPKDVPTLWFNFRLTNCAYPTDFNVLRHILTL